MAKFTVCINTYIVVESDDLESAYELGDEVRGCVAVSEIHRFEDQVIDVELGGVYEIEEN